MFGQPPMPDVYAKFYIFMSAGDIEQSVEHKHLQNSNL